MDSAICSVRYKQGATSKLDTSGGEVISAIKLFFANIYHAVYKVGGWTAHMGMRREAIHQFFAQQLDAFNKKFIAPSKL